MKFWVLKRKYPEKFIENEFRKVKFCKEGIKKAKGVKGISFVVTYHPRLKNLGSIIHQNIYLLNMNEKLRKYFRHDLWFHLGVVVKYVVIYVIRKGAKYE